MRKIANTAAEIFLHIGATAICTMAFAVAVRESPALAAPIFLILVAQYAAIAVSLRRRMDSAPAGFYSLLLGFATLTPPRAYFLRKRNEFGKGYFWRKLSSACGIYSLAQNIRDIFFHAAGQSESRLLISEARMLLLGYWILSVAVVLRAPTDFWWLAVAPFLLAQPLAQTFLAKKNELES